MAEAKTTEPDWDGLSKIVADLQVQAQTQAEEKHIKTLTEINTKAFDRSAAYNNIILVAGYAGGFTIWSFTRSQMPEKASVAIAFALLFSLSAFVIFEVVKMYFTGQLIMSKATVLKTSGDPAEKLRAIKAIEEAHTTTLIRFMRYWAGTMIVSVCAAVVALALLAYNFMTVLTGLPGWPQ